MTMLVRDWMSAPAVAASSSMEAPEALDLMEKSKFRRLPVVEGGRLVGIITRRDLEQALGREPTTWRRLKLKLSDVMKANPLVVPPQETLEGVARLMLDRKIGGIPVVEDGAPVGMITESDLFRALCKILGFGEKGTRIEFTAPAEGRLIEVLRERLKEREPRTLLAHLDERRNSWEVILRLETPVVA